MEMIKEMSAWLIYCVLPAALLAGCLAAAVMYRNRVAVKAWILKYQEGLTYTVFGALTTVVNLAAFFFLYLCFTQLAHWKEDTATLVGNLIAWVVAMSFSFLTNKPFVFHSHDWSLKVLIPEAVSFVGCRIASFLMEEAILWISVSLLGWNVALWKIIAGIFVIIANYFASKLLVFRKK